MAQRTPTTTRRRPTTARRRKAVVRPLVIEDDTALLEREHDAIDNQLLDLLQRLCA